MVLGPPPRRLNMSNLLVLAALILLPAAPLDECEACRRSKVCTPHRNQDKAELKRLAPLLASKDAGQRMSALSVAAGLTEEHENAPGKEVAKVLARALADDQLEVRQLAIELLVDGQHPETAVTTVVAQLKGFERNMWSLVGSMTGPDNEHGTPEDAMQYLEASMRACSEVPDDRVVKALSSLLGAYPAEMRGEPVAMAATHSLLELQTQGALEAVIKQLAKGKDTTRLRRIHMSLVRVADEKEIEKRPAFGDKVEREWTVWLRKNKRAFPAKLGKWDGVREED